jgi:hypothetical protein
MEAVIPARITTAVMISYLPNPFTEAYVTHTVSNDQFVRFFSQVLVIPAAQIFQPGNVIVKGTQGSGKSMLLRLLDPEIRIAYYNLDHEAKSTTSFYPVPLNLRKFISARVDLNRSGLLDIINTLQKVPTFNEISELLKSFADFFNYCLLYGLLHNIDTIGDNSNVFTGLVRSDRKDVFAAELAAQDCWYGALSSVSSWEDLKFAIKNRVMAYRAWANGNQDLSSIVRDSRTRIGEPLSKASAQLKTAGVIDSDTNVFATIDQLEALWMQGNWKRELGQRLRCELHEVIGKRDERISYRIGARRYDWGKGGSLAMRDGRELEEGRDFQIVDIDALLRRPESAKKWSFRLFAKDVFERRVRTMFPDLNGVPKDLHMSEVFFGPSPTPQEVIAEAIKKPDFERLIKLDSQWPTPWTEAIKECYNKRIVGIPTPPLDHYPCDPINAILLVAWGLQTGGRGRTKERERRSITEPPHSSKEAPWTNAKKYWRKERYPLAVLQLISRHKQRMLWWGEPKVFSLSGSNILRFITISRITWDYWQRLTDGTYLSQSKEPSIVPPEIQSRAILEASRKVQEALKRQPGQPAGDVRGQFIDKIAGWLRNRLLNDAAMSNPGQNGFSLLVSEINKYDELRQLIEEAVGWGDLYEMDHTSKIKKERESEPRKKYYLNPALSPFYGLPEAHTKEPVYAKIEEILQLAIDAKAVPKSVLSLPAPLKHEDGQQFLSFTKES